MYFQTSPNDLRAFAQLRPQLDLEWVVEGVENQLAWLLPIPDVNGMVDFAVDERSCGIFPSEFPQNSPVVG